MNWTSIAKEHNDTEQQRANILVAIAECQWQALPCSNVPMLPGLAIKAAIAKLRLPKVSHVSWNTTRLAPCGFYGIRAHYKGNLEVDIFLIDDGSSVLVCCHQPKTEVTMSLKPVDAQARPEVRKHPRRAGKYLPKGQVI